MGRGGFRETHTFLSECSITPRLYLGGEGRGTSAVYWGPNFRKSSGSKIAGDVDSVQVGVNIEPRCLGDVCKQNPLVKQGPLGLNRMSCDTTRRTYKVVLRHVSSRRKKEKFLGLRFRSCPHLSGHGIADLWNCLPLACRSQFGVFCDVLFSPAEYRYSGAL